MTLKPYYYDTPGELLEKNLAHVLEGADIRTTLFQPTPWTVYPDMYYTHTPFPAKQFCGSYDRPGRSKRTSEYWFNRETVTAGNLASLTSDVEDPFSELDVPDVAGQSSATWAMWHGYVLGSLEPRLSQTWYGETSRCRRTQRPRASSGL